MKMIMITRLNYDLVCESALAFICVFYDTTVFIDDEYRQAAEALAEITDDIDSGLEYGLEQQLDIRENGDIEMNSRVSSRHNSIGTSRYRQSIRNLSSGSKGRSSFVSHNSDVISALGNEDEAIQMEE